MSIEELLKAIRSLEGVFVLAPGPDSDAPEIAWGDYFFYYAPDGQVPQNQQPFATIVTKDYPDDELSRLDALGRWRINIHAGRERLTALAGGETTDFAAADVILPHPVYAPLGWVAVVNPGERTEAQVLELATAAHEDAKRRATRRT